MFCSTKSLYVGIRWSAMGQLWYDGRFSFDGKSIDGMSESRLVRLRLLIHTLSSRLPGKTHPPSRLTQRIFCKSLIIQRHIRARILGNIVKLSFAILHLAAASFTSWLSSRSYAKRSRNRHKAAFHAITACTRSASSGWYMCLIEPHHRRFEHDSHVSNGT